MNKKIALLGLFFTSTIAHASTEAIITCPVVDLLGDPLHQVTKATGGFIQKYDDLPVSFKRGRHCPRLHQLLFNERVTILERCKDQVKIQIPQLFYQVPHSSTKKSTFWAPSQYFTPIKELIEKGVELAQLPEPISYERKTVQAQPIISLIEPFADPITKQTYSTGTRFAAAQKKQIQECYLVYAYDTSAQRMKRLLIPSSCALIEPTEKPEERVHLFVDVLKRWAHKKNGFIPYVWGGCSFINLICHDHFDIKHPNHTITYFYRKESEHQHPKNGFDCSNLVARAAQLCRIPYYFKNTTTALRNLPQVAPREPVRDGDLVWYLGHIMIVSNAQENKLIEAGSYDDGYGKVHEIPLSKVFKGVSTYADLQKMRESKQTMYRLTKLGTVSRPIYDVKILRLPVEDASKSQKV